MERGQEMPEVKITKNFFEFGGVKYHRGGAEDILLGSAGDKEDPVGPKSRLAVHTSIPRDKLRGKIRNVTTASIDWSSQSKAEVDTSGGLKYLTFEASGTGTFSYETAKSAKLKLMKVVVDEGALTRILNEEAPGVRKYLKEEGRDGRLVGAVWIVAHAKIVDSFATAVSSGGSVSADLTKAAELELTAHHKGGTQSSSTVVLRPKTTFAYLMYKVTKWDKDKVGNMEADEHGLS